MTTYSFNLSLDEQEFWAIKEAMEFYLSTEARELRKKNPHLVKYAADIKLNELLSNGKLYKGVETKSSNNFEHLSQQNLSGFLNKDSLFEIVVQELKSNSHLLALAETPIADMFVQHPKLSQLILNCIIECLENSNATINEQCKHLIENDVDRDLFCSQVGKKLYGINSQSHPN